MKSTIRWTATSTISLLVFVLLGTGSVLLDNGDGSSYGNILYGADAVPTSVFPTGLDSDNDFVNRSIDLAAANHNGGAAWVPSDNRGDINLNGVPNEVADAVLLGKYFTYGLRVFRINRSAQIAATDVNADGLTLSVGDLVYLIGIIE